jgi:DNA-binding response OmpR family regulator
MRRKILVIEDDGDLTQLLAFNLKRAGYAIGTARDGVEGLKKARSISPHLILLDLMLPEMDGLAVCETLRRDSATASIPVLILTAVSGEMARLAGFEAGANAFMKKPFSPRELLARVESLLSPKPAPFVA